MPEIGLKGHTEGGTPLRGLPPVKELKPELPTKNQRIIERFGLERTLKII